MFPRALEWRSGAHPHNVFSFASPFPPAWNRTGTCWRSPPACGWADFLISMHSIPRTGRSLAALVAFWGMVETARCLGRRWTLYYAGVLLLLYTDLMILAMAVLLFLYP